MEVSGGSATTATRAGLKARGPGAIFTGGPQDEFHDVIVRKIDVFADSQCSRLLFPVVDYAPAVLTRLLAELDC